jgi:putative alpha-1,2-mannosidase
MGTQSGGNDFPGAARPFGMVKLGPDLLQSGTDSYAGYLPNGKLVGNVTDPLSNITVARSGTDAGSVGYYRAQTADGVEVELSASARAGIYRYTFPSNSENNILVDVSHVLPSFRGQGLGQNYEGGNLTIFADGHYEGLGTYNNGWNEAPNWTIYFCECARPICGLIQMLM